MKNRVKYITKKDQKYVNILDIKVLSTSLPQLLTAIEEKITHNSKFYILTPNPELVLASQKDVALRNALNNADFAVPDGVGLKLADISLKIIKGRELFMELINLAKKKNWKVFLLGGLDDEAEVVAKKYGFEFAGGSDITPDSKDIIAKINQVKPDLLFVAFGNPNQEIWINENLTKLHIRGAMAVGGTFRYISGLSKLPPKWLSNIGLEWLWRVLTEPKRIKRILNATVLFPVAVFWYKINRRKELKIS